MRNLTLKITRIYKITNLINNKVYIGQAQDIYARIQRHKSYVKYSKDSEAITILHRAMKKYGWSNFSVEVLEAINDPSLLDARETFWISHFDSCNRVNGYNILPIGRSSLGFKHCEESKTKMSKTKTGMFAGELNPMYGKTHKQETKAKIAAKAKLRFADKNNNPMYGKKHSEANLAKMRRPRSVPSCQRKPVKQIDINTGEVIKIWTYAQEAPLALTGKKNSHIGAVCNGLRPFALGFKWCYV